MNRLIQTKLGSSALKFAKPRTFTNEIEPLNKKLFLSLGTLLTSYILYKSSNFLNAEEKDDYDFFSTAKIGMGSSDSDRDPKDNKFRTTEKIAMTAGGIALMIGALGAFAATRYVKCPPNKILVVYGARSLTRQAKTVHGGGAFVLPIIQDYAFLNLNPMQIEIDLKNTLSKEKVRVNVPSVFTVAIGTTPELMNNAAQRLLELDREQIKYQAQEIIYGQMRDVIATMNIDEINSNRHLFSEKVGEHVETELEKLGLTLINVNFTDVTDEAGVIQALGKRAAETAVQTARVEVAEKIKQGSIGEAKEIRERDVEVAKLNSSREIGVKEAEFNRDTVINNQEKDMMITISQANAEREIGINKYRVEKEVTIKQQQKDLDITISQYDADKEIGIQQANFKKTVAVAELERDMRVSIAKYNAEAVEGENLAFGQIEKSKAQLQVVKSESYALGETKEREVQAAVAEAEHLAREKTALAYAKQRKAELLAQVVAPAEIQKLKTIIDAEANARQQIIFAEAEAKAKLLNLEAIAKGELAQWEARAKGTEMLIKAAGGAKEAIQLLLLDHIEELAKTSSQAISNIKFDNITVWETGKQDGKDGNVTSNFIRDLATSLPPVHDILRDVCGVDMKKFLGGVVDMPKIEEKKVKIEEVSPQKEQK